jgi:acetylornithine deacetylase/succinyl-diaminopimelate desuccinylase-like protein
MPFTIRTLSACALAAFAGAIHAQSLQVTVTEPARAAFAKLNAAPAVKQGLAFLEKDDANTFNDQKALTEIPAPPFKEQVRAEEYRKRLAALGLKDVRIDSEGNAIGVRPGTGNGPRLVISSHLDTVFPEGTDVTVKEKDGRYYAPGIADDTRGLAAMLSVIRAFNATGIRTAGDIVFVGTVGEEGLGDLRGVKALFRDDRQIDGFIAIDGADMIRITVGATGSKRYRIAFKGPGGHSFSAFGLPSAIHAMGRAITKIGDVETPKDPKTTFTVGTVGGGTSVNAIAGDAVMEVDMRSNDKDALAKLEAQVIGLVKDAVAEENKRWGSTSITVDIKLVGDRPAGIQAVDSPVPQAALLAHQAAGFPRVGLEFSSTDSNLAINLGVPAATIRGGGKSAGTHSVGEWYQPQLGYVGPQAVFLTALALVGVEGVTPPLLPKRPR